MPLATNNEVKKVWDLMKIEMISDFGINHNDLKVWDSYSKYFKRKVPERLNYPMITFDGTAYKVLNGSRGYDDKYDKLICRLNYRLSKLGCTVEINDSSSWIVYCNYPKDDTKNYGEKFAKNNIPCTKYVENLK